MNAVAAWLLDFGEGRLAAVGLREVLHIAYAPRLTAIPQTPAHCSRVLIIEERVVPVWEPAVWLGAAAPEQASRLAAIVGYQNSRRAPVQFGALLIAVPPLRIMVSDEDACALPATPPGWRAIAMSCVRRHDRPIPILDLRSMFSAPLFAGNSTATPAPCANMT